MQRGLALFQEQIEELINTNQPNITDVIDNLKVCFKCCPVLYIWNLYIYIYIYIWIYGHIYLCFGSAECKSGTVFVRLGLANLRDVG